MWNIKDYAIKKGMNGWTREGKKKKDEMND